MPQILSRCTQMAQIQIAEHLSPLLNRIYASRGVKTARELEHGLDQLLPFGTLMGVESAVARLMEALRSQQHVLILGDFDADGATSSAVAVCALRSFGLQRVSYLVPNRFEYGYGLTPEIVAVAARQQPDLIVTVDNGISSVAGVEYAMQLGIEVIVTDHHLPGEALPPAVAIVNPNQTGDPFPSKHLAGVGVIFYVMLAVRKQLRQCDWFIQQGLSEPNMADLLDLVALGTIADVVPLDHNNRILVQQGLQRIRAGKARAGIQALLKIAERRPEAVIASDLAFAVAPRLNAAGRLEDMSIGIACLLANDPEEADALAARLDGLNHERRGIETSMQQQAFAVLEQLATVQQLPPGLCVFDPHWHQGVIGIVASRVKDHYHRPVIAFAEVGNDELKGSARSITGVHMRDALDAIAKRHPHLIQKFGGHAMAAGLTLQKLHYPEFCQAFAEEVARHVTPEDLLGTLWTDGALSPEEMTIAHADLLRAFTPWGQAFPEPLFDNHFSVIEQRIVGTKHLKLMLQLHNNQNQPLFSAIAFNVDLQQWPNHRVTAIRAVYRLEINEYLGRRQLQLVIAHLEPAEGMV